MEGREIFIYELLSIVCLPVVTSSIFSVHCQLAITALKKGARLLKYGRRGKPKFCPFRLSVDESALVWYVGKVEKQLMLSEVSKVIPGQRTAIFQRYPQPDKEYQSFSLIYKERSLDLICKDKDEAEAWFVGLKTLISGGNYQKKLEVEGDIICDTNASNTQTSAKADISGKDSVGADGLDIKYDNTSNNDIGRVLADVILCTAPKSSICAESISNSFSSFSSGGPDNANGQSSGAENVRISSSSAVSSISASSYGSCHEGFDALSDVFIWGEITTEGCKDGIPFVAKTDAHLPKALQSAILLDVQLVAGGSRHVALVTKQGKVYSWGEESGGRLGHGVEADVSHPKLVDALADMNIQLVACGESHTCAVTLSGDLYTWGDGTHNSGVLGHGSEASHWIPKLVAGPLEGLPVSSVSCGPWHTAIVTSSGQLFTFGDGTFGVLGHGDHMNLSMPREVEALQGFRTVRAACGVWHTAAVVEIRIETTNSCNSPSGKLFTWGDGDKSRLGHGDREHRLVPACITMLAEESFCQVACGQDITIALTVCGRVFTMGSSVYGQLGNPQADVTLPTCVEGKLSDIFIEEIACGSHHAAVLTSRTEVYTWGKGENGQLGQGDNDNRNTPTLVEALKGKHVKRIVCGPNFTAAVCIHKWVSSDDLSMCSGCRLLFGFRRKRHNCYNCGLVFCKLCSTKKSVKAALAPNIHKPYRVCDECYTKIKKMMGSGINSQIPKHPNGSQNQTSSEQDEKETVGPRLSSIGSFKGESRRRQSWKSEPNNSRSSPILSEGSQWGCILKGLSQSSNKMFSASVPGSRIASRSTSPVSSFPSPPYSTATQILTYITPPELVASYSKKINSSINDEIATLHLQVQDLTYKCQILEAKLERTSEEFREATATAGEKNAKYEAAKEVNKLLTYQLKGMAERLGEGYAIDTSGTLAEELVELDEPGIFITVSFNPEGDTYLKRVHLSGKQFNEQQAEQWWMDNRQRLQQKYNFRTGERHTTNSSSVTDVKNEMVD